MAGSESVKKNEMTDILDPNVKSKPVLPSSGACNKKISKLQAFLKGCMQCTTQFVNLLKVWLVKYV